MKPKQATPEQIAKINANFEKFVTLFLKSVDKAKDAKEFDRIVESAIDFTDAHFFLKKDS